MAIVTVVDLSFEVAPPVKSKTITVGHYKDYPTIQQGINASKDGDIVEVYDESYHEAIIINKSIDLIGIGAGIWGAFPGMPEIPMLEDNLVTITADHVNISGFYIFYCGHAGIEVLSNNNNIFNNDLVETAGGSINLHGDYNTIQGNNINDGVRIYNSEYNTIIDNDISVYDWRDSILLENSNWNTIERNSVEAIMSGIHLSNSKYNDIIGNEFTKSPYGSYYPEGGIHFDSSHWNRIINNEIVENDFGIWLESSSNNSIHHNSIINNTDQAIDDMHDNLWDNGYPSGGNYWSDYTGVDLYKGPNQDIPGSDGIGDTNYTIDSDSLDHYPLMGPSTYKPLENFTILKQGWNLVSIPLIQENENLPRVLEMIDGYYDAVQSYDASDIEDPWKNYIAGKPFGNDLLHLNETLGFWIHITQPGDSIFCYNGTTPTTSQKIQLYKGWNLVGYPSLTSYNRTDGLNDTEFGTHINEIMWYNATTKTWHTMEETDYFHKGVGYWFHAKEDVVWHVPL